MGRRSADIENRVFRKGDGLMTAVKEISASSCVQQMIERMKQRAKMVKPMRAGTIQRIECPGKPFDRFEALREFYAAFDVVIHRAGKNNRGMGAYTVDWLSVFTPIEYALWHDIRNHSCVMYPQYPVGRYFVDFANPVARVAIECDGAAWHQDYEKDAQRQRDIEAMGWTVYRITGRDCKTDFDEVNHVPGKASQFVKRITELHDIVYRPGKEDF